MTDQPSSNTPTASDAILARPVTCASTLPETRPLELAGISRRGAALDLALLLLVALVIPYGFDFGAALSFPDVVDFNFSNIVVVHKWFDAALLVALTAYFIFRHGVPSAAFGVQSTRLGGQILWAVPIVAAIYTVFVLFMLVVAGLLLVYPGLQEDLVRRVEFMDTLPLDNFWTVVLLMIPVAIHEELLFRGLLIPYLHRVGCRWWAAIAISTALFAALHFTQGWLGMIQVFGVGAVLGLFFVLTRSALAVILAHFLFNFAQVQVARVLLPWLERFAEEVGTA